MITSTNQSWCNSPQSTPTLFASHCRCRHLLKYCAIPPRPFPIRTTFITNSLHPRRPPVHFYLHQRTGSRSTTVAWFNSAQDGGRKKHCSGIEQFTGTRLSYVLLPFRALLLPCLWMRVTYVCMYRTGDYSFCLFVASPHYELHWRSFIVYIHTCGFVIIFAKQVCATLLATGGRTKGLHTSIEIVAPIAVNKSGNFYLRRNKMWKRMK